MRLSLKTKTESWVQVTADGKLMNYFITVANIASREPDRVRDGNERVVRPRLADAAFAQRRDVERHGAAVQDSELPRRLSIPDRELPLEAAEAAQFEAVTGANLANFNDAIQFNIAS